MPTNDFIPFLDLVTPHADLKEELCRVFATALDSAAFIGGPAVQRFEEDFAKFCDTQFSVGVASGTDALRFALIAAGVGPGDAVITTPTTFIATVEAISQTGAVPIFVDIDEATHNLDPEKLRDHIELRCDYDRETGNLVDRQTKKRVAAIVPVHLYGQMADMDPILDLASKYCLIVIEDACQAHGAEYFSRRENRWYRAGSMGVAAAFSFYPGKNLGACGEAGAITTNNAEMAHVMRMLRDHGQPKKYYHDIEGYNGRLDAIQAGFLHVKLRHLATWNDKRRECAARYQRLLAAAEPDIRLPYQPAWSKPVYHLYPIRTSEREQLQKHLTDQNIGTGIHYPIPLHLQKAYARLGYQLGDLPVAERVAAEILSLPMFPELRADQQSRVAEQVLAFVETAARRTVVAG